MSQQIGLSLDLAPPDAPETLASVPAANPERPCACGCGVGLTGRQKRFSSRLCCSRWWDSQHPRVNVLPEGREGSIRDAIEALLADGQWRTVHEIAEAVRAFPHSVSARLAEIRRSLDRVGMYTLESDAAVGNTRRAHRFRVVGLGQ